MNASYKDWTLGYRSKGPDGTKTTCALSFPPQAQHLLDNAERVSLELRPPNGKRMEMYVRPHPAGFMMNRKPGAAQTEVNVAWGQLEREPPTEEGKGRLTFWTDKYLHQTLIVDITPWKKSESEELTLFEQEGKILLPKDSTGTGAFKYPLFD